MFDYQPIRDALNEARDLLAKSADIESIEKLRQSWPMAMNDIEAFLDGDATKRGFSIVRSLDAEGGNRLVDSEFGQAMLRVARAARDAGIDRYR